MNIFNHPLFWIDYNRINNSTMDDDYGYDSDNIDEENQSEDYFSSPSEEEI